MSLVWGQTVLNILKKEKILSRNVFLDSLQAQPSGGTLEIKIISENTKIYLQGCTIRLSKVEDITSMVFVY